MYRSTFTVTAGKYALPILVVIALAQEDRRLLRQHLLNQPRPRSFAILSSLVGDKLLDTSNRTFRQWSPGFSGRGRSSQHYSNDRESGDWQVRRRNPYGQRRGPTELPFALSLHQSPKGTNPMASQGGCCWSGPIHPADYQRRAESAIFLNCSIS